MCISMYVMLMCDAALRWLREDVDIPDSKLFITLTDFEVIYPCYHFVSLSH